jgi:hypothetical protein
MTSTSSAISAITPRSWVMSMMARSVSSCSRRTSARICACVVTSSAVVGSSAISTFGWPASAMAIIARWRSPPDNCQAYSLRTPSGRGIPTWWSSSAARSRDCFLDSPRCNRMASPICEPTVCTGLKELMGSWKTSPMSPPRTCRISGPFAGRVARSTQPWSRLSRISPSTTRPGDSTMPSRDRAVMLLPQPVSPTTPSVLPAAMVKLTPSTARVVPSSATK